jgi:uncharacterized protein
MTLVNHSINYIEMPLTDAEGTKAFYHSVFGWEFQEWGPGYLGFTGAEVHGGFSADLKPTGKDMGTLVVLFAEDLQKTLASVKVSGAIITRDLFEFPGGRRFQFVDPNGNELAVWGDPTES